MVQLFNIGGVQKNGKPDSCQTITIFCTIISLWGIWKTLYICIKIVSSPDLHHTKSHQQHAVLVEQWYDPGGIADCIRPGKWRKKRGWNFKIATNASQIIEVLNAKALILETFPSKVSTVLYDHNRLLLIITFDNLDFLGKHNLITCPKEWTKNYGCEKAIPKHSFLKLDVIHFHPNVTQFPASSGRNCDLMKVILVRCVVTIKWFRMHNVMSGKNDF